MIKGEYEFLQDLAKNNVCAKCKGRLEVIHHETEATWRLRCNACGSPEGLERIKSLTEETKIGDQIPLVVAPGYPKRGSRRDAMSGSMRPGNSDTGLVVTDLGSSSLLTQAQVQSLIDYANTYGLDAYRGHVVIMYGKPYIGLDGYLYHANRSGRPYSLRSHPVTGAEAESLKLDKCDHGWIAEVSLADTNQVFTGVGVVTYAEMTEKSNKDKDTLRSPVVAKHPWQLGQKRAEWQALRRAFPIGEGE